jgi:hypothetical protein
MRVKEDGDESCTSRMMCDNLRGKFLFFDILFGRLEITNGKVNTGDGVMKFGTTSMGL